MKPPISARPHLIIMVGIPGAGKSTFAERFAATFQAPLVSANQIQKKLFGAERGQGREEIAIRAADLSLIEILKTKHTTVYDGSTNNSDKRLDLAKQAKAAGYQPLLVWVQTESGEAERRTIKSKSMTVKEFDQALQDFSAPSVKEKAIVISGRHAYVSQLKIVLRSLAGTPEASKPIVRPKPRTQTGR